MTSIETSTTADDIDHLVEWWGANVRERGKPGANSPRTATITCEEAEARTGLTKQQVSRWANERMLAGKKRGDPRVNSSQGIDEGRTRDLAAKAVGVSSELREKLPPSWRTLYEIMKLPTGQLEKLTSSGVIHPAMTRADDQVAA